MKGDKISSTQMTKKRKTSLQKHLIEMGNATY